MIHIIEDLFKLYGSPKERRSPRIQESVVFTVSSREMFYAIQKIRDAKPKKNEVLLLHSDGGDPILTLVKTQEVA